MMRFVRGFALVWIAGAVLVLPACQDDPTPTPVPLPPPPVRGVIASTSFTDFSYGIWLAIPIPLAQAGALDFVVDWTFTNTYMGVAFGTEPCTIQQLDTNTCPFLMFTQGTTPKPRMLVTRNLAVGNYFLYLYNKAYTTSDPTGTNNVEAVALQIGLTVGLPTLNVPLAPIRLEPQVIKP